MADATLAQVREFFGYPNLSAFSADWKALPNDDREQIKQGLGDGSLSY